MRLPRLEVRRRRAVPRGALRAREQQLLQRRCADVVPAGARSATSSGRTWATRQTRPPLPEFEFVHVPPEQTFTSKRWQESNWLQALEGGIDSSHVSWLHSGGLKNDPLFKGAKGNEYNLNDLRPFFEVAEADGGLLRRGTSQRRGRQVLLADHALGHAELHDGAAARRPPRPRPLLGADRRRELLGLHVRLPPDPRAHRRRGAGDEGRPRRPQPEHPGHVPAGWRTRTSTT